VNYGMIPDSGLYRDYTASRETLVAHANGTTRLSEQSADFTVDGDTPVKYRVLLVDNSESDAFLLSQLMSVMGHTVAVATNGADALRQVALFAPQLIVADIDLPDMDGYEWARRVRATVDTRNIVIAALTNRELEQTNCRLNSDFDMHLTKPVEITDLQTLFELLARRS
jgi:CheY-like chemotaxis protein